mgnify:CR=1 FL=1
MNLDIRYVLDKHKIEYTDRGSSLVARCPLHEEKTASFSVDPEKNVFYCFGCSEGGDSILLESKLSKRTIGQVLREVNPDFKYESVKKEYTWLDQLKRLTYTEDNILILDTIRKFWPIWRACYVKVSEDSIVSKTDMDDWYYGANIYGPWNATRRIFGEKYDIKPLKDGWILNGPYIKDYFIKW